MSDVESAAGIPYYVSDLLASGSPHWGAGNTVLGASSVGKSVAISFAFMTSAQQAATSDRTGFAAMSTAQKAAVRLALATWSAVANITFTETTNVAGATITFATNRQTGSAAYAYYPSTGSQGGTVFVANNTGTNTNPTTGSYGFMTLVHEIGHALGLKHPGDYNAGSSSGGEPPYLPAAEDNSLYSVMSYNDNDSLPSGSYLVGPSLYDIAAIQYLYGANTTAAPGNDTYTLSSSRFVTLWDPNGTNTLDGSSQTQALSIDLRGGGFSTIGSVYSVGLAYGTLVQKANGGTGDDVFTVNSLGNSINGGAGSDAATFSGTRAQYTVTQASAGAYIVSGVEGNDALINVEYARFSDTTVPLASIATGSFDALRYICSNADLVAALGTDTAAAINHYLSYGVTERRSLTGFDPYNYLAGYSDLQNAFGTNTAAAMRHYITYGKSERRTSTAFDTLSYEASNPDLIQAFGTNTEAVELHYLTNGRFEHRSLTTFNATAYLAANPDLSAAFGSNLTAARQHYIQYGFAEHRKLA